MYMALENRCLCVYFCKEMPISLNIFLHSGKMAFSWVEVEAKVYVELGFERWMREGIPIYGNHRNLMKELVVSVSDLTTKECWVFS